VKTLILTEAMELGAIRARKSSWNDELSSFLLDFEEVADERTTLELA
jgi:hypothetical protein